MSSGTTLLAERWLDELLLFVRVLDVLDADFSQQFTLPAGLGDVAVMAVMVDAHTLATPVAAALDKGIWAVIASPGGGTTLDLVGTGELRASGVARRNAFIVPDHLILWRQNELLEVQGPELDTNVSDTGVLDVYAKVVRVRPLETPSSPLQLVR